MNAWILGGYILSVSLYLQSRRFAMMSRSATWDLYRAAAAFYGLATKKYLGTDHDE